MPSLKLMLVNPPQWLRFIVVGAMAVSTDYTCYQLLTDVLTIDIAKGISFILGSVVAFFMNKIWTFNHNSTTATAAIRFTTLYSVTFFANVLVNHVALLLLFNISVVAFLLATATSTILNYLGMKYWVFSQNKNQQGYS
jgi:putative flippase GtrA